MILSKWDFGEETNLPRDMCGGSSTSAPCRQIALPILAPGRSFEQLCIDLHRPFPLRGQVDPDHAWKLLLTYMEASAFYIFLHSFIHIFPLICPRLNIII